MASSMSVADVAAFAASSLVEFAEVIVIAVATSVPVAGLCIGVPVVRIITACLRGQRTRFNYIRWWLTCAVSLLLLVNLLFLAVGIGALWLQMPPDPAAMSKGTCRVVSAGVDLRSVKLCTVNDTSSSSSSSSSSPTWLPSSPPTWQAPSQASPHPSSRPFATQSSSSPYASPSPPSSPNHPSSAHVSSSSCHSAPPSSPSTASPPSPVPLPIPLLSPPLPPTPPPPPPRRPLPSLPPFSLSSPTLSSPCSPLPLRHALPLHLLLGGFNPAGPQRLLPLAVQHVAVDASAEAAEKSTESNGVCQGREAGQCCVSGQGASRRRTGAKRA
ncbi:hypothetical protein CLOP_g17979 [Closterium sp. NIES-67]|nr:hypothetical protein CLOP_g17979 [Closterium sp. NIES-67]